MNSVYVEEVKSSLRNTFLQADLALAEDCSISPSSGTTALAAFIFGRYVSRSFSSLFSPLMDLERALAYTDLSRSAPVPVVYSVCCCLRSSFFGVNCCLRS